MSKQRDEIEQEEKLIYEGYLHLETGRRCPGCGAIVRSPATACILCKIPFEECEELERPVIENPMSCPESSLLNWGAHLLEEEKKKA